MNNQALLAALAEKIKICQACSLYKGATQAVPGEGDPNAQIFFIGEGPGFHEDKTGRPFVGRAGQLLEQTLESIGLHRNEVFIGNVIKHRPPENRDPFPTEISACNSWLDQQLAIINPKVVVTLGRFSMAKFLPGTKITLVHGVARKVKERVVLPMYHPAAALRSESMSASFRTDFEKNKELLLNPDSFQPDSGTANENQISLFS